MQIAETLVRLKHTQPDKIKSEWFKIPFEFKRSGSNSSPENEQQDNNGYTEEEYQQYMRNLTHEAKARWGMRKRMGYQPPQANGNH